MLGFADPWAAAGYWLTILSALACLVYGILNWNRGLEQEDQDDTS